MMADEDRSGEMSRQKSQSVCFGGWANCKEVFCEARREVKRGAMHMTEERVEKSWVSRESTAELDTGLVPSSLVNSPSECAPPSPRTMGEFSLCTNVPQHCATLSHFDQMRSFLRSEDLTNANRERRHGGRPCGWQDRVGNGSLKGPTEWIHPF